ncbi:unnamed protein product [Vicia faba]|uniref:Uncharacterized protein n=1 Tax=Vicia faba TaxID=3906 RepID=A0AAV0ZP09_VICFA|nr:unnamed protein product [Vicia faba]
MLRAKKQYGKKFETLGLNFNEEEIFASSFEVSALSSSHPVPITTKCYYCENYTSGFLTFIERTSSCGEKVVVQCDSIADEVDDPVEAVVLYQGMRPTALRMRLSGVEDVSLIEYAHLMGRPYRVFSLDTGRLNPKTYRITDCLMQLRNDMEFAS